MEVKEKTGSIVKINPAEYGLTETKAKEIEKMFKPMLDKMVELENEFNQIAGLEINQETCSKARELRLRYVKVRTGTANIHRELKAFYLKGGKFVDGWKNAQLFASQGIEEKLSAIENYHENLERQRIAKLQEKRAGEMAKYEVDYILDNLGEMPEDVWNNFLLGTKTNYEAQKEAERKAEQERIEDERKTKLSYTRKYKTSRLIEFIPDYDSIDFGELSEKEYIEIAEKGIKARNEYVAEQEQIRIENEQLKKEADKKEAKLKRERIKREKVEAERLAKEEAERKIREENERKERAAYETELQKERKERERVEQELRARQEQELKENEAEEQRIQTEKRKADDTKITDLINDLETLKGKYEFKSEKYRQIYTETREVLAKIIAKIIVQIGDN